MEKLIGLTRASMDAMTQEMGLPRYASSQILRWIYRRRVRSIDEMTDLSLRTREALKARFEVGLRPPVSAVTSKDGTSKYLFPAQGASVETVFIPDQDRGTVCVSSQVGCRMACRFCMTGRQGFSGNLTASEIINQVLSLPMVDDLTNLVFMGMGEPLDNLDAVLEAISILTSPWGLGWSPKRITLSTSGLRKGLDRALDDTQVHIAVSLHSPLHEQRALLMPAERAFPIRQVVEACRLRDFSHQRRLSFEYIVFRGINDRESDLKALVSLLRGLDCRVNLIRFHRIPDSDLEGVDSERMVQIRDYLTRHGLFSTIRASRGEDVWAACGMLSTADVRTSPC